MAVFVTVNQQLQLTDSGMQGSHALTVTKRIKSDTALDLTVSANAKELRDHLGEPLVPLGTFSVTDFLGPLRLWQCQMIPVAGSGNKVFDAVLQYDTAYRWANISPGGGTDRYCLPVELAFEATERPVQIYRNPSFTTSPTADLNTTADIGGTKIDTGGKPVDGVVNQTIVKVSMLVDVSQNTLTSVYDDVDAVSGKWNSASLLHWSANQVFCASADVLVWDEWLMCDQVPARDADGYAILDSNKRTATVYWNSLNRGSTNIDNIIFGTQPDATLARQMAKEGSYLTYP
jgi:hypothetical protein